MYPRIYILICLIIASIDTATSQFTYIDSDLMRYQRTVHNQEGIRQNEAKGWIDGWHISADLGVNTYWADHTKGNIVSRSTPQVSFSLGKWLSPTFGVSATFTGFSSRANKYCEGLYTRMSQPQVDDFGRTYWHEFTRWWDVGVMASIDVERLFDKDAVKPRDRNHHQWRVNIGAGITHHYGLKFPWDRANEISARIEIVHTVYFPSAPKFGLDLKLRALIYDTNYDGVKSKRQFDANIALCVGTTFYAGIFKSKSSPAVRDSPRIYKNTAPPSAEITAFTTFPYLVNFEVDRFELSRSEQANLRRVAEAMKHTDGVKYVISGYVGSEFNGDRQIWMALNRARSVYDALVRDYGVDADLLVLDESAISHSDWRFAQSVIIACTTALGGE